MTQTIDEKKFYEGKFTTSFDYDLENPLYRFYLKYSIYVADWLSFAWVRPCRRLLDIGCGGGKKVLKKKAASTIGIDLSLESLERAAALYDWVVVANVDELPFREGVFDCVYSAHLMGHIPQERKEAVLSGIHRVTAQGGENVHYIETDGDNFAVRFAKQFPALYRKNFIELNGHFGLEKPSIAMGRIQKFFKVSRFQKFNSGIFSVEGTLSLFDGYPRGNFLFKMLWNFYCFVNKSGLLRRCINLMLGPIMGVYNYCTPFDQGDWILVRCVKN